MLHLDASTKYFWFNGPADFRKGFDGLCGLVKEYLITDVTDGGIFILSALSDHTMKLIKISQLDSVLNIFPTVEESIDAVFMHEIEKDMKDEE